MYVPWCTCKFDKSLRRNACAKCLLGEVGKTIDMLDRTMKGIWMNIGGKTLYTDLAKPKSGAPGLGSLKPD